MIEHSPLEAPIGDTQGRIPSFDPAGHICAALTGTLIIDVACSCDVDIGVLGIWVLFRTIQAIS